MTSWRDRARPIIAEVISLVGRHGKGSSLPFVKKALRGSYVLYDPTELREHWPYQVWLDEVRRQLRAAGYPVPRHNVIHRGKGDPRYRDTSPEDRQGVLA